MKRLISALSMVMLAATGVGAQVGGEHGFVTLHRTEHAHAMYQRARDAAAQTERISRTIKVGANGELDLSNISGDIVVTGGSGNEIRLEAIKRASDRSAAEATRQLGLVSVDIDERPERAQVRTLYTGGGRGPNVSVDYTVSVPSGLRVTLRSISGDVKVTGVKGELRAESVSGNVAVDAADRVAMVKSVSGDVQIDSTSTDGDLTASSVSGSIRATNLKARSLDFGTVSGEVILSRIASSRANVRSVSGGLRYNGPLAKGGRYEMKSHSGDVRVLLVGDVGFELAATSYSGDVRCDLPIADGARNRGAAEGNGPRRGNRSVEGQFGDGSAILDVTTFSGDIVVGRP